MRNQVEAVAAAPVEERANRNRSPLTNQELFALCKKHFQNYTFEEFLAFCDEAKPKWLKISTGSQGTKTKIVFALDKKRAFFAHRPTFAEALVLLEQDIWDSFQVIEIA